eukprot:scaffold7853_cov118-Cylindrotheca_fusiformis.AAC.1
MHLAVQFLLGCNWKRCGALVAEAINAYHRGDNHYPRTLDTALCQLSEFEPTGEISTHNDRQGSGMAFFQNGEPNPGRGGHGGRGGGRGRGAGGRNSGRENSAGSEGENTNPTTSDNANNESVNGYVNVLHAESFLQGQGSLPSKWLLLDSCSSVDLISNKDLLHDVHPADASMRVHCNAGTVELTQQGYFGDYPLPVWYNPKGIANILSLHNVSKLYQ